LAVFLVSTVMIHMFVISPLVYFIFTRKNPFKLIAAMIPAYIYALGCSSSMATLPWTSQCLETTRAARRPLINCVTSITSILHMNGTAIYLSLAMFFLVDRSGHSSSIGAFQIFMVVLGSFLGSFLTAPIPGGSVITLITIWGIVMPEMQVPEVYVHLIAVDVILDRFITMANIHGDMIITSIIAEQIHDKPTEYQF
jgi:Na+/H+-dicarboxylate symporter